MVRIHYGDLRIDTVSSSSGIFAGNNHLAGFRHSSKQNQAFGNLSGEGAVATDIRGRLHDRDRIDTDSRRSSP